MQRVVPSDSGQAAVESALVLPLSLFVVLGFLQLFLVLQARILAQVAVSRAVRAGSVNHGDCEAMTHTAIAALLPSITATPNAVKLADAFYAHRFNRYPVAGADQIVELVRDAPLA